MEIKVLHVIASMDPAQGGVCQAVRSIIKGLNSLGVHNEVVSLDSSDAKYLSTDPFKINTLGPGKGPWAYNKDLKPWMLSNIGRFDFIINHGLWLYPSHCINDAVQKLKSNSESKVPKLYVMPHGMLDPYFQRAEGRKIKAIRNWIFWKLIERKVVNQSDGLLFTCEEELRLAREPFRPYYPVKELVVGLGVDTPPSHTSIQDEAFYKKVPQVKGAPFILFLSRIHEKKGVEMLIKAYKNHLTNSINSSGTDTADFPKLVVAGPGLDTDYGKKILELVEETEILKEYIFFPGMLAGDSKWGAFYNCEAFVLPSHQENFGIAVVESLACGKPVLISNQVNIWREIDRQNACIVDDDTLEGTSKMIEGWLNSKIEIKKLKGEKAEIAFKNIFSIRPAAEKLLDTLINN
jgi:glycosyltransferase involved in cell wall biosynthesis